MNDGLIKGTGNSRYLKSVSNFATLYPTYASFVEALVAGTLPIDLSGINDEGWTQLGTTLNKANLLSDATAAKLGDSVTTPDQAFAALVETATVIEATLASASWSSNQQTISNDAFEATGYEYIVGPAYGSKTAYDKAKVAAKDVTVEGKMTFTCTTKPTTSLTVRILKVRVA